MPSRFTTFRLLLLLLLVDTAGARAQVVTGGSPYSAYGVGDLMHTGQVSAALMGGTGIAYTEQFGILPANPASYAAARYVGSEGLLRPVFQGGICSQFITQRSETSTTRRTDAQFTGLTTGIPFGKGRWGLAFGLTPFSDVDYKLSEAVPVDETSVTYEYTGTGGLSRVFAGLGRVLWQAKPDSTGHLGGRLAIGANFDFLFGSIERTRKALYPYNQAYTSTAIFSSLVLRAPTGSFGLHYSDAITSRARAQRAQQERKAKSQEKLEQWRLEHVDTTRMSYDDLVLWRTARTDEARLAWLRSISWKTAYRDSADMPRTKDIAEARPWRFTLGATASLPTVFSATSNELVTSFRSIGGLEALIDTLMFTGKVEGTLSVPVALGVGLSVHNTRWLFTAEVQRRDWAGAKVDVEGYSLPSALQASMTYAAGLRYTPSDEGGVFQKATYRAGARYTDGYLDVRGTPLSTTTVSGGISFPLNAVQTNSYLHIGAEYGQRGTTSNGLLEESFTHIWFGVSITPWKRERWFQRYQIQ